MRKSITLFDDQYAFYKELKSEKLLVAFVEFMFEDIEPHDLNSMEQTIRNSLLERMNNWKWKSDAWAKSHWWWRPKKQQDDLQTNNNKTTKKQQKNNKQTTSISISRSISNKIEDKVKVEDNKKNKYLDFVYLSEEEHQKLTTQLWPKLTNQLIEKLNNYIWSIWKDKYKSHYYTILNRSKNEAGATTHSLDEERRERERQRIREEAQAILSHKQNENGKSIQNEWVNRRTSIAGC